MNRLKLDRDSLRAVRALALGFACALLLAAPLPAQVGGVQAGQRVRLTLTPQARSVEGATEPQRLRGEVARTQADSLWLLIHPGLGPTSVALGAIQTVELSGGVEPWWEAAWRQGKKTALTLGIEAFVFRLFSDGPFDNAFEAALVVGGIGMVGGGIVGGLTPQEVWQPLPWPAAAPPARASRPRS